MKMCSAQCSSMLALILTVVSVVDYGLPEILKMKVSLTNREDGRMAASICVGNLSYPALRKISLEYHLDTILDDSQELIGAKGLVRERNKNNTVDLSNMKEKAIEEELKDLWEIFCHEEDEEALKVVSRDEWGTEKEVIREKRTRTADFLIVDGVSYTYNGTDYYMNMREIEYLQLKFYGDLKCNFFISDDGQVFEGVGLDHFNFISNGGLGPRSLIIGLIKSDRVTAPSAAAMKSLRELTKTALCMNKLSLKYRILPYYLIDDYYSVRSDYFERKEVSQWNRFMGNLDSLIPFQKKENLVPIIVPRDVWSENAERKDLVKISSPIQYVVIRHFKARCFFNCTDYLKVLERFHSQVGWSMDLNFFLAEDGRAYEFSGWSKTWHESYNHKRAIVVGFMGQFNTYGPSKSIFLALEGLIQNGLRSGNLSPDYKIVPFTAILRTASSSVGKSLRKEISKLDRYSEGRNL